MYKISDEFIKFIEKTMTNWSGELTVGGKNLRWKSRKVYSREMRYNHYYL